MKFELGEYAFRAGAIWRFRRTLAETEKWAPERRRAWVQERLERTLEVATRHVPYYRRTLGPYKSEFPDMIDRLDLTPLPFVSKRTIQEHFDELIAENGYRRHTREVTTSGSTGMPTTFVVDRRSAVCQFAAVWRALNWTGYRFGDRFADLRTIDIDDPLLRYDPRMNCQLVSVFRMRRGNAEKVLKRLDRFRPSLLKTYPSALFFLCQWMEELGLEPRHQPRRILVCAEMFFEEQRERIESVFQAPIFDFYSHNERAGMISTCEQGRYHVHEEYSQLEFVPYTDGVCQDVGEVVATTLHNDVMPLIRYQTQDDIVFGTGDRCACGRTLPTIERIIGRFQDVIVTSDGAIHSMLGILFAAVEGIVASQIRQEDVDAIEVLLVRRDGFDPRELNRLEAQMREVFGLSEIDIYFRFVDAIRPERNGKIPFIVSKPGRHVALDRMEGRNG